MNERKLKIMKDAFFSGFEACFNTYDAFSSKSWTVAMERAWGEYMLALEREERKARDDDEIDKALGLSWEEEEKLKTEPDPMNITITKETLPLPEALEEHSKYCPNGWGYQREHDRLMLEEVDRRNKEDDEGFVKTLQKQWQEHLKLKREVKQLAAEIDEKMNRIDGEQLEQRIVKKLKDTIGDDFDAYEEDFEGPRTVMEWMEHRNEQQHRRLEGWFAQLREGLKKEIKAEIAKAARAAFGETLCQGAGLTCGDIGVWMEKLEGGE